MITAHVTIARDHLGDTRSGCLMDDSFCSAANALEILMTL